MNAVHFSSKKQDWATPWELFRSWDITHGPFNLDVCATEENAKCDQYFSPQENGLSQPWGGVCWMNPPYGRDIKNWVAKAVSEVKAGRASRVVCLLPARTDTAWWHENVIAAAAEIIFLRGRIKFEGAKHSAPFPSALVIFEGKKAPRARTAGMRETA